MSFKASIWAGRFAPDFAGLPDPLVPVGGDAFAAVLERFADRGDAGRMVPPRRAGWYGASPKRLLGYIAGEYVIYHRAGFAEVVFGGVEPRIDGFLIACRRELGRRLLDANNWEWVTDAYPRPPRRGQPPTGPDAAPDPAA